MNLFFPSVPPLSWTHLLAQKVPKTTDAKRNVLQESECRDTELVNSSPFPNVLGVRETCRYKKAGMDERPYKLEQRSRYRGKHSDAFDPFLPILE
ncbi:uncharacterized protein J3R85_017410 [Psidium guajava]|nr:uncharacterized protein J3R85_017410 [Psidium guajava]